MGARPTSPSDVTLTANVDPKQVVEVENKNKLNFFCREGGMAKEKSESPCASVLPPPGADGARCERLVQSTKSKVLAIHPVWVLAYYLYPLLERGATRAAPRAESLRPYLGAESSVLYKVLGTVCRPELPSPRRVRGSDPLKSGL